MSPPTQNAMPAPDDALDRLVAHLSVTGDSGARLRALSGALDVYPAREVAERLKEEADRARYQDPARSLRWCADIGALGEVANAPPVVALGRMAEAFTLYEQGRHRDALTLFDEASALFRAHGDEVGGARAQIGRTLACMTLGRFDEALERAREARAILEQAGEHLHVVGIDHNLALLLERMNRPAEALIYNERALAAYRDAALEYYIAHALSNRALLLWRLGRVREAIEAHQEARQSYVVLGAAADAACEDLNIGTAYLALGHYAHAVSVLTTARRDLCVAQSSYLSALAGLYLVQCLVHVGRFHQAIDMATDLCDEFTRHETPLDTAQTLVWRAQAHGGLGEHEAALSALDTASTILAANENVAPHRAAIDVSRARLLQETGRADEAHWLLHEAIPVLRRAGMAMETAVAQVLWGSALIKDRPDVARAVADDSLLLATREGLDWLAARALHLRGRAETQRGDDAIARDTFAAAIRHLDRVHRHVAWDDRASFAGTTTALYADATALALRHERPAVALRYAEQSKARAMADHLRARIDIRPRARDERSRALIEELGALRERYAWLGAASVRRPDQQGSRAIVRRSTGSSRDAEGRAEVSHVERRMAEIWRELQASNPAYRGEVAALALVDGGDDTGDGAGDDEAAERWLGRVQAALGSDDGVALLEYTALGDDLALFVVRAGQARAVRLEGATHEINHLVPLLRLNVERRASAVVDGGSERALRSLDANARGLLCRLYGVLLAPALPLLDGVSRLVIVPHGPAHHVPFHALHDGRGYVIERLEVSYAPCAGLIEHFAERQHLLRSARGTRGCQALALACSDGGALPHVAAEGQAVVAAFGGLLLREEQATLGALRGRAGDCDVLHLAAHACFRPDEPLFSSLRLHDGQLSTLEVFDLELSCSLATLSACETALGTTGAGDELMGLSRAFLYAGAPSLLLSLWKVEDRSTALLMGVFYEALCKGVAKASALRRAQLALLRGEVGDGSDTSAPFYWAPFQLIGHAGPV